MAIGRTFQESLQKALRGLETGLTGLDEIEIPGLGQGDDRNAIRAALGTPTPDRLLMVAQALRCGTSPKRCTSVQISIRGSSPDRRHRRNGRRVRAHGLPQDAANLRMLKAMGFSDARLAELAGSEEAARSPLRRSLGVHPVFKRIDTCAAEFASPTAYMYSTYERPSRATTAMRGQASDRDKVDHPRRRPNRIGQGIEFDYCCCHAASRSPRRATRPS
jgi:carbamoyl-phosphate synthase large subunit